MDLTTTAQSTAASIKAHAPSPRDVPDWVETLARLGYAAKGVVYAAVGVLSLQAAFSVEQIAGSRGALLEIAQQPFGRFLLGLIALGLIGYVVWRFVQAAMDPENKGSDAEGIMKRTGYAASGLVYALLALFAARVALGSSSGGGGNRQSWTAELLSQTWGQWALGILGVIVIGTAVYYFVKAYRASFMKRLKTAEMNSTEKTWTRRLGRWGISARGVIYIIMGWFFIDAARSASAGEVRGLEGALQTLAGQPYGVWLLTIVAAGLIGYGVYCFARARYRTIQVG